MHSMLQVAQASFVPGRNAGGPGEGPEALGVSEGGLEAGGLGGGGLPPMYCPGGPGCGKPIMGGICHQITAPRQNPMLHCTHDAAPSISHHYHILVTGVG